MLSCDDDDDGHDDALRAVVPTARGGALLEFGFYTALIKHSTLR